MTHHHEQALLMLEGRGAILDVAREVSRLVRETGAQGAVIGGVAVVLHGHVRTTLDVDLYLADERIEPFHERLIAAGFTFDPTRREYALQGVPVHRVRPDQVPDAPRAFVDLEDIRTVTLADLIAIKLRSGSNNLLRAQDLADVIGLIRYHGLDESFAVNLPGDLRLAYRQIEQAISTEHAST